MGKAVLLRTRAFSNVFTHEWQGIYLQEFEQFSSSYPVLAALWIFIPWVMGGKFEACLIFIQLYVTFLS